MPSGETVSVSGYFPLVRDSSLGSRPASQEAIGEHEGANIRTLKTDMGHMKKRTCAKYHVDLPPDAETRAMQDLIHDLYYREIAADMRKIFNDKSLVEVFKRKLWLARYRAFKQYIETAVNPYQSMGAELGETFADSCANWLRQKTTSAMIMMNFRTRTQNFANWALYANSVDGFTWSDTLAAATNFQSNLQTAGKYNSACELVHSKSSWMAERMEISDISLRNLDTSAMSAMEQVIIECGTRALVATDNFSAIPVWLQAYIKAIRNGSAETEAVSFADTIIRRTLGSSRPEDVAPFIRNTRPVYRMFTMFHGFLTPSITSGQENTIYFSGTGIYWG
ncbi:MAG: hypothetical protein LUF25_01795 [Phascolarctobacterium sp.]|nr:hypothetical protein [Phascolarctobacterium sp.]